MSLSRIYSIILRQFYLSIHELDRFFSVFFYPTLALILWGFVSKYAGQIQSSGIISILLGGLILWTVFETVDTEISVSFMYDIWERNTANIFSSPITIVEYLVGFMVLGLIKIILAFGLLGVLASVFYNFNITSLGFGLALFWINLVLFGWAFGIFNFSLVLRFGSRLGPLTWTLPFLIQPFAGVFYPVSVLPEIIQKIAFIIPISHVFEGMRYTLSAGSFDMREFIIALSLNIVYLGASLTLFLMTFRTVKRNGRLVRLN